MRNVFITGGTHGIGRGLVRHFLQKGYHCITTFNSNAAQAEELLDWSKMNNYSLEIHKIDHSKPQIVFDEIVQAVDFLADKQSDAITGQVLNICGGYSVQ